MSTFYADLKRICETEKLGNRKLCAKLKTTRIPMNVLHEITQQLNDRDGKKYEERVKRTLKKHDRIKCTEFEETFGKVQIPQSIKVQKCGVQSKCKQGADR